MEYKVKLSCTIPLSSQKEADIIRYMNELKAKHKLGDMVANCVRFCWEHKEELEKLGFKAEKTGVLDLREEYFKSIGVSLSEMRRKVDKIYEMAFKTYLLAQFNKRIGLEEKSKNSLSAEFILERQIDEIAKTLGVDSINSVWLSNKQENTEEKAKEVLEYILEVYDGIVSELKDNVLVEREYFKVKNKDTYKKEEERIKDKKVLEYSPSNTVNSTETEDNNKEDIVEPIDFDANADFDLLNQFIGL